MIFDTTDQNPAGEDFDLVGPFGSVDQGLSQNFEPGNVLIVQERNDCDFIAGSCAVPDDEGSRPGGEFEFSFSTDIVLQSLDFFDIEAAENSQNSNSEIHLYDGGGAEIQAGLWFVPVTGGDNTWNRLNFDSVGGVRRIVIELNGSGAIDNLAYQVVPAPAAVWLLGSALALLGCWRVRSSEPVMVQ
ncbi:MAG: thrombospondin type 3 repeat:Cna B-type [Gammaproteobacteria bacterium]